MERQEQTALESGPIGRPEDRAAALGCWRGPVELEPLAGGISNHNFVATDRGERFVVRIGDDVPAHGVSRFNEVTASRAAFAAGIAPELVHAEPGAMVLRFIENGRAFSAAEVRRARNLSRILELVRRCHTALPKFLRHPLPPFRVFRVVRRYCALLAKDQSRLVKALPRLLAINEHLEASAGSDALVLTHNDLLAANFVDDGERLWLIDWEYAGYNSALFDLGNISANSTLSPDQEEWLLEAYYGAPVGAELRRRYAAMKCASALREALWSAVSETYLALDVDYVAYTDEHLGRFEKAYEGFRRNAAQG